MRIIFRHWNMFHAFLRGNNPGWSVLRQNNPPWYSFSEDRFMERVSRRRFMCRYWSLLYSFFIFTDSGVWQSCCLAGRWKLTIQSHDRGIRKPKQMKDTRAVLWPWAVTLQSLDARTQKENLHNPAVMFDMLRWPPCLVIYFQTKDKWATFCMTDMVSLCKQQKPPALCCHVRTAIFLMGQIIKYKWNRAMTLTKALYFSWRHIRECAALLFPLQVTSETLKLV